MSNTSVSSSDATECPSNKRQRVQPHGQNFSDSGLNSSASSLTTITTDLSLILRRFECCVCLEHISPPILQCPNAHFFCQTCRQNLRTPVKCPECREPLPKNNSRCYPMEQIAVNLGLLFSCKYSSSGCSVTSILTEKKNHENQCQYRPFKCWLEECEWSGDKQQMVQHLIDVHFYDNYNLNLGKFAMKLINYNLGFYSKPHLLSFKGQDFIIILDTEEDESHDNRITLKVILLFIGEQRIADQFQYRITMRDRSNRSRFNFEDRPHSIRQDVRQLLDHSNRFGFVFDENLIKRFTDDNNFAIKVTIIHE